MAVAGFEGVEGDGFGDSGGGLVDAVAENGDRVAGI